MFGLVAKLGVAGLAVYGVVAIVEKMDLIPKAVALVDELLTKAAEQADDPTDDTATVGGASSTWAGRS